MSGSLRTCDGNRNPTVLLKFVVSAMGARFCRSPEQSSPMWSTKAVNCRSPMLRIGILRVKMRMLCHSVDDFIDAAKVAISPPLLTIGPACWKSPNPMNVIPPNGFAGWLNIVQQSLSTLSHAALLTAGSSSHTIAEEFQIRSARGEWGWMELCTLTLLSVTGMPNIWCAMHPRSYAVALNALLPTISTIWFCAHSMDESALTKNVFPHPGCPSMKKKLFLCCTMLSDMHWTICCCSAFSCPLMLLLLASNTVWLFCR